VFGAKDEKPQASEQRTPDTVRDVVPPLHKPTGVPSRRPSPIRRVTIPATIAPVIQIPALDARIWLLAAVRFVVTAGFAVVMPFLAMHLVVDRGVSVLRIGGLWAMSSAGCAAMQWIAGYMADRIGRRPVLIAGMVVRSLNLALLGYAIGNSASFALIGFFAIMNGALRGFYDPVAWAVVASLSSREERVAAFSLHRVGSSLGWVAGPLVATLAASAQFSSLFYVCAPFTLLAPILAFFIDETRPEQPRETPNLFATLDFGGDPMFLRFLFASFAYFMLQTQMYHMMSVFAAKYVGLGRAEVGTLFTLNAILVVVLQLPAVQWIRKIGTARTLVFGSVGYMVAFAACGLAFNHISLLACVGLITLCEIMTAPAQQARVTALAPPDKVARYTGIFGLFQGAAQTIGPVLGVFLLETVSPRGAWFVLATLGLAASLLYRTAKVGSMTLPPPTRHR
jgi:MFS family permease